ncbi:hypothetical protein JZ785_18365 [Alicyclobacillus curvatus]|nr:hypothetical protein JZ785_18365 [Alicyclobacillus curvatus]
MKKRLIATSVIALGAFVGLTGCGQVPTKQNTPTQTPVANITSTGHTVRIDTKTGTQDSGIAQVTLLSPVGNLYQYAVPVSDGNIQDTLTVPWTGKTSVAVTDGSKMIENVDATVKGPALSEQQLDLLPSYLMDSNIPTVANQAHAIASSVDETEPARTKAVASATMQWVKRHIHATNQAQPARADQTLASGSGNQASRAALAIALLRADNIPSKAVQAQVMSHGLYSTSYAVDAWLNGKWTNIGTP